MVLSMLNACLYFVHSCPVIYNSRTEYGFILNFTYSTVSAQKQKHRERDVCATVGSLLKNSGGTGKPERC